MVSRRVKLLLPILCSTGALFITADAVALQFSPTELEWVGWPNYCRARYVVSGAGANSRYATKISRAEVSSQKARMGNGWEWLHHYCAALVYMKRADAAPNKRKAEFLIYEAEKNFRGYHQRINKEHPMFLEVVTNIAQLHRKRGDERAALSVLEASIKSRPTASSLYALTAMIHRDSGDTQQAVSALLQGNEAVDGSSAEIHYFLGLFYIELDDLDSAVAHAERAYDLGYPLSGLASKLQRLGHPME